MNIIVVTDYAYENGGAGKIAIQSAKALCGKGHRVFLFTAVGPISPLLLHIPGLTVTCTQQFEIINDPNRLRAATQGLWNFKAGRMMRQLLTQIGCEDTVAHIHMWGKALSSSVIRAITDFRIPTVITLHEYLVACPTAGFFNHQEQKICRLAPMSRQCCLTNCDTRAYSQKLWRLGRQAVQQTFGRIPARIRDFISISDLSESVIRPLLPSGTRLHRVSNFIDVPHLPPVSVENNNAMVFSGRLVREKGVMLWAECARTLELEALFIGDGDHREKIKVHLPNCEITGWLDSTAARTHMQRGRAVVFPSLWYETQGLVVAEASAMGIPSIVGDQCSAREWVTNEQTGLWFRHGDLADLCLKVSRLRDNPQLAQALGAKAYAKFWQAPPTLQTHVKELESVYSRLLAEQPIIQTDQRMLGMIQHQ